MELTLTVECWIKFVRNSRKKYASIITKTYFIIRRINRYNDRLLQLLRQFLLIPNRINKLMALRANFSNPCFNYFYWDLINIW